MIAGSWRMGEPGATVRSARVPPGILAVPLIAMIIIVFVCPLVWFFIGVFADIGGIGNILPLVRSVITSEVVLRATLLTLWIAFLVTLTCIVLAYPIAFVLAQSRGIAFTLIIITIVIPYFTSVIVRTYSWMVLLGRNGLVNQALLALGLVKEPLPLMYDQFGILVGMTYILLPYMVLTLFAVMRGIDGNLLRAARGMGASGLRIFWRIHLPLSLHGVLSGSLIVFILAIGFFITPALMGGPSDVMIAMLIEREVELTLNWPVAAVMSLFLLIVTLGLFALYSRFTTIERMMA
jgi:putative spermidine/putrescine transport system permease protein